MCSTRHQNSRRAALVLAEKLNGLSESMSYLISLHFQKLARPWLKYNNHNRNSNTGKFRVYVAPYKVAANEFNLVYHAICVPGSSAMFRVIGIASLAYAKIEIRAMDHDVQEVRLLSSISSDIFPSAADGASDIINLWRWYFSEFECRGFLWRTRKIWSSCDYFSVLQRNMNFSTMQPTTNRPTLPRRIAAMKHSRCLHWSVRTDHHRNHNVT